MQNEVVHTQMLVDAKMKEIESEEHRRQVTERENGRLEVQKKTLEKQLGEVQEMVL